MRNRAAKVHGLHAIGIHVVPVALSLLLAVIALAHAQTSPSGATQPAPLAALQQLLQAVSNGDEKPAFSLIHYSKPENRQICETILAEAAARHRLSAAVAEAFKDDPTAAALQSNLLLDDQAVLTRLDKAKVTVKTDAAEVTVDATIPAFEMVNKDGKWLLDFEKTQENAGPLPKARDVAESARRTQIYNQIAADLKAKKFQNARDVAEAIQNAQNAVQLAPLEELKQ
ncbi:MAG TPA: hypothetical protein VHM90_22810 [Phycisphaerae bacterium]|nr:hypothetical protein [Phycisphaerae bacterium]